MQNFAPPSLLSHMQSPRSPNPVLAPTESKFFVLDPSTNPLLYQFTDQFAVFLGPKSSSMHGKLNLSNPHVPQQQSLPRINFHNAIQSHNTHLQINSSSPNRNVNPPPVIAPLHLVNYQVPVIPPSIASQVLTLNKPPRNPVCSPQAHQLPCPNAPKLHLNRNPDLNWWRFPQNKHPNVNPLSNNATVLNNPQPILPPNTANPAISHAISQSIATQTVNSNHAATCINQVNTFSMETNIGPRFVTPIIPHMYGHTAPAPLCWGSPLHPTPPVPTAENANPIKALADAITSKRNDPLPEWKLSQYSGDPLQWHQRYVQFKNTIDFQSLTDDVKLTYLKTLVAGS